MALPYRLRRHLVDVEHALKLWSVRLNAVGIALLSWVYIDPVSTLSVWNMMPAPVRALLPQDIVTHVGMGLFALSMLARFVKQPKLAPRG